MSHSRWLQYRLCYCILTFTVIWIYRAQAVLGLDTSAPLMYWLMNASWGTLHALHIQILSSPDPNDALCLVVMRCCCLHPVPHDSIRVDVCLGSTRILLNVVMLCRRSWRMWHNTMHWLCNKMWNELCNILVSANVRLWFSNLQEKTKTRNYSGISSRRMFVVTPGGAQVP